MIGPPRDIVSEILKPVRLYRAHYLDLRLTAPFSLAAPLRFAAEDGTEPFRHVSQLHFVLAGGCMIETREGHHEVSAGDLILLPFPDLHAIRSGNCPTPSPSPGLLAAGPFAGLWMLSHGGGGPESRIVSVFLDSSEFLWPPLFRSSPRPVILRAAEDPVCASLIPAVTEALVQIRMAVPGSRNMLERLMESLFVRLLRQSSDCIQGSQAGWHGAVSEPIVRRALQLLHGNMARRWTLTELARLCGASRTVLSDRFNAILGRPPMDYLLCWRMQLAAARLAGTRDPLARIAEDVGYASEAAFSRAFRRVIGASPREWRERTALQA